MTEKYKIYIPEEMRSRLINDAELFEFTKNDGSVNLNAFLKELLVNYFDQYRETKKQLLDTILSDLSVRGKMILPSHGKEFFTSYGKHFFTCFGKQIFT